MTHGPPPPETAEERRIFWQRAGGKAWRVIVCDRSGDGEIIITYLETELHK
jgi:hypothetical protein